MVRIDDVITDLEIDVRNLNLDVGECLPVDYLLC